jgi:hypothetical protein
LVSFSYTCMDCAHSWVLRRHLFNHRRTLPCMHCNNCRTAKAMAIATLTNETMGTTEVMNSICVVCNRQQSHERVTPPNGQPGPWVVKAVE